MSDPFIEDLKARYDVFKKRPFPTDWAKVVNGIGLVSLTMRAERCLGDAIHKHLPRPTIDELLRLLDMFERALPAPLPSESRGYFEELRDILAESLRYAKLYRAWHFHDRSTTP
jgi:hypothetical protein